MLQNRVSCYKHTLKGGARIEFKREVDRWIDEGISRPWEGEETNSVLPLMAVVQPTKNKVRPKLNEHQLSCHTSSEAADVCGTTFQVWRCMTGATAIVNLKSACL